MTVDTRIFHWTKIRPFLCERRPRIAKSFGAFLCRPCTTTTWNFRMQRLMAGVNTLLFLLTWLLSPGIQLQGNSPTFDILSKLALSLTRKNLVYFFNSDVFAAVEVVAIALYFLWHLNKTDSALKRIPKVGPCRPSVLFFDFLQFSQLPRTPPRASRSQRSLSQLVSVLVKQIQLDYLFLLLVKTVEMLKLTRKHQLLNW